MDPHAGHTWRGHMGRAFHLLFYLGNETMKTETLKQFIRSGGYAWPGGYQMALLMEDGEVIDSQSARENYRLIRRETGNDWKAIDAFIHWEGESLYCAHSGREIPSAYGEIETGDTCRTCKGEGEC